MEATNSTEISVTKLSAIWRQNEEGSHLQRSL